MGRLKQLKDSAGIFRSIINAVGIVTGLTGFITFYSNDMTFVVKLFRRFGIEMNDNTAKLIAILFLFAVIIVIRSMVLSFKRKRVDIAPMISFETTDDEKRMALESLLDGEKALPSYVHFAAKMKETSQVVDSFNKQNLVFVGGESGTGKSTLAYQVARILHDSKNWNVREVLLDRVSSGLSTDRIQLKKQLLLLGDVNTLLIIDDVQQLGTERKNHLLILLEESIRERKQLRVLWLETEFVETEELDEKFIRVNGTASMEAVLAVLETYREDGEFPYKLQGLESARKLVEQKKIQVLWQLLLVATRAEDRLSELFVKSMKMEQLLVLFVISMHTVITGEKDRDDRFYVRKFASLKEKTGFSWLEDIKVNQVLEQLNSEFGGWRKLIILENQGGALRYVRSLHYNFARMVIRLLFKTKEHREDYIQLAHALLDDEITKQNTRYMGIFLHDINDGQSQFIVEHESWLLDHLQNLDISDLVSALRVLQVLKDPRDRMRLVEGLDLDALAVRLSLVSIDQIGHLAEFIKSFPKNLQATMLKKLNHTNIMELINEAQPAHLQKVAIFLTVAADLDVFTFHDSLDISRLSSRASEARLDHFIQLVYFNDSLKKKSDKFLQALDVNKLTDSINNAETITFDQVANLLYLLPIRQLNLALVKLDVEILARQANKLELEELLQLQRFIEVLHVQKEQFLSMLDMKRIADMSNRSEVNQFDSLARLIKSLSNYADRLIDELDVAHFVTILNTIKLNEIQPVHNFLKALGKRSSEFVMDWDFASLRDQVHSVPVSQFKKVHYLVSVLGEREAEFIDSLDLLKLRDKLEGIQLKDMHNLYVLVRSMRHRAPEFRKTFDHDVFISLLNVAKIEDANRIHDLLSLYFEDREILAYGLDYDRLGEIVNRSGWSKMTQIARIFAGLREISEPLRERLNLNSFAEEILQLNHRKLRYEIVPMLSFMKIVDHNITGIIQKIERRMIDMVDIAYIPYAVPMSVQLQTIFPGWGSSVDWARKLELIQIVPDQLDRSIMVFRYVADKPHNRNKVNMLVLRRIVEYQATLIELLEDHRITDRMKIFTDFIESAHELGDGVLTKILGEEVSAILRQFTYLPEEEEQVCYLVQSTVVQTYFNEVLKNPGFLAIPTEREEATEAGVLNR